MRICLCEAEKLLLTYCSKFCCMCSVCRQSTICLNTPLTTLSGWTRLVQWGGTRMTSCRPPEHSGPLRSSVWNQKLWVFSIRHIVLNIRSSSHHTFLWNCILIRLSYLDFSTWELLKPLPRKKRRGGTQATASAKVVSWAVHSHFQRQRLYHDAKWSFLPLGIWPEALPWCQMIISPFGYLAIAYQT